MKINDSGVRLRETPGLDGKIIRILSKGESVSMEDSRRNQFDNSFWINVKTDNGMGWVYSEYVSLAEGIVKYKLNSNDSVSLCIKKDILKIGMTRDEVLKILGKPESESIDDERKEEWLEYDKLSVMVMSYNKRVNHFTIKSDKYPLINEIKVGENIKPILEVNKDKIKSYTKNDYSVMLANYFYSTAYDCGITLMTDDNGKIIEIQIGGPVM
jgi:hypothetical protein